MTASSRAQPFFRRSEGTPAYRRYPESNRTCPFSLRPLLVTLLLVATSFAGDAWIIREDGVGPVKIGMTLAELSATLHQKLSEEEGGSDNCFYVSASEHDHMSFMIIDGHVVRAEVNAPGIRTSTGIQVGDSEAKVRKIYGTRAQVTANPYLDTGLFLTIHSADGRHGVRFVTDKGKVTMLFAGNYDAIQYVEGCE